jgi:hypothetical protein
LTNHSLQRQSRCVTKLQGRISAFLYHEVVDNPAASGFQRPSALSYKHSTDEFARHLEQIASAPARVSLITQIDLTSPARHLLMTFDDGGRSAMYIADQIEARGWRGHFFVTTSLIGTRHFVSAQDVADLHRRGHLVGSHSHSHPDIFYALTAADMVREWRMSMDILSDIIGASIELASIPGGDMDLDTQLTAAEAGLRFLFTSERTVVPWRIRGLTCLGRVCPPKDCSPALIRELARFRGYRRQMLVRKSKNLAKRVLYPYYRRMIARNSV